MNDIKNNFEKSPDNLIWIDLEMTGLNVDSDYIIEIATVVTNSNLDIISTGPVIAIFQEDSILESMDKWNKKIHGKSGLIDRVKNSPINEKMAEKETLKFLKKYVLPNKSPMCGNTICQDRRFLYNYMPKLEKFFHYRQIDVSTIKELAKKWGYNYYNNYKKKNKHMALYDILESIEELKYYKNNIFNKNNIIASE